VQPSTRVLAVYILSVACVDRCCLTDLLKCVLIPRLFSDCSILGFLLDVIANLGYWWVIDSEELLVGGQATS
jgi:hypothetical protein